jgi:glycosyltransferase involved in cell wall biosynthesis
VIDCQVLNTPTWHRGIGKYSLELLTHARGTLPYDDVVLLLNADSLFEDGAAATVRERLGDARTIRVPLRTNDDHKTGRVQAANRKALDAAFEEHGLVGADFLILAPFLGTGPCSVFPRNAGRRLLLFYDIIPLLYHRHYLAKEQQRAVYLPQYRTVFEADLILTISQSVADDLGIHLGIPERRMVNIGGAGVSRADLEPVRPDGFDCARYVLFPSGGDFRKNNETAVAGFQKFLDATLLPIRLVITSRFTTGAMEALRKRSDSVTFVGNVPEPEMAWLFQNAEAVLFASQSEGLGLPVLEAVEANKPVVCSDIAPFREMSGDAFYFCDPYDTDSISDAIHRALVLDRAAFDGMRAHYPAILERFSWGAVAERLSAALQGSSPRAAVQERRRLAVVGPHPSGRSEIGKMIQELHAALCERFDVEYYLEMPFGAPRERPGYLGVSAKAVWAGEFDEETWRRYDDVVYHLGNDAFHFHTARHALHLPGHVVLHDTDLDDLLDYLVRRDVISAERRDAERLLESSMGLTRSSGIVSFVNRQRSVIVHSEFDRLAVQEAALGAVACHVLNLPVGVPRVRRHAEMREARVGLAGVLRPELGTSLVRRLALDPQFRHVRFDVFGSAQAREPSLLALKTLPNVTTAVGLSDHDFQRRLSEVDILLNFRQGYRGEASLGVLEAMRYGVVNIVRGGVGWFEELPSDAVVKVKTEAELRDELARLIHDAARRESIGHRAQEFVRAKHSHELYAAQLADAFAAAQMTRAEAGPPAIPSEPVSARVRRVIGSIGPRRRSQRSSAPPAKHGRGAESTQPNGLRPRVPGPLDPTSVDSIRAGVPAPIARGGTPVRASRAVARRDFDSAWLDHWAEALGEPWQVHRKLWEWCEIMQAAREAGAIKHGGVACGFGVGREPVAATLAGLGMDVLATDLPTSEAGQGWTETGQHAAGLEALMTAHIDPDVVAKHVIFQPFNMNDDVSDLGVFDLVWSSCVIEHLGSPGKGLDFVHRSLELLKPGGVAVHTTEMELLPRKSSVDYGNCAMYRPEELRRFFRKVAPGFSFDANFRIPLDSPDDCHIDLPPYGSGMPHLKLKLKTSITTSYVITIRRDPR